MDGDLPPYLSVSQITTYLQCPRKYWFRYVERREPEHRSVELAFGIAVHASVAWWVGEHIERRDPSEAELRKVARVDWASELAPGGHEFQKLSAVELGGISANLVVAFAERYRTEALVGSEVAFEVELWDPVRKRALPIPLKGYIDIVTPEGFIELKTCSKKTSWRNWSLQLGAYAHAERERTGRVPLVRVVELLRSTEAAIHDLEAQVSDRDRNWFLEVASDVHRSISRRAWHPIPTYMCTRCEYAQACRSARP